MTRLPLRHPLARVLQGYGGPAEAGDLVLERLRASRPVFRFSLPGTEGGLVGKFFEGRFPPLSQDLSLAQEYRNYRFAAALGLTPESGAVPRLLGQHPGVGLGVLLEAVPGPDLDQCLGEALQGAGFETLGRRLEQLAALLVFFHTRPLPRRGVSRQPAWDYFRKLQGQLGAQGLLTPEQKEVLAAEGQAWEARFRDFADGEVLLHGDATPTNFLFPDGRAVAVDLERLRGGDRLFDLSWVAGELRHAFGWRGRDFAGSEEAIRAFFRAYLAALGADEALTHRIFALNPFYMALAELRIARNGYLSWGYRQSLVREAVRCLRHGRRLP